MRINVKFGRMLADISRYEYPCLVLPSRLVVACNAMLRRMFSSALFLLSVVSSPLVLLVSSAHLCHSRSPL